jgi:hypothetical protein
MISTLDISKALIYTGTPSLIHNCSAGLSTITQLLKELEQEPSSTVMCTREDLDATFPSPLPLTLLDPRLHRTLKELDIEDEMEASAGDARRVRTWHVELMEAMDLPAHVGTLRRWKYLSRQAALFVYR